MMVNSLVVRIALVSIFADGLAGCGGATFYEVYRSAPLDSSPSQECVGKVIREVLEPMPNFSEPVLSNKKSDTGSEYFEYTFSRGDALRDDLGRFSNLKLFGRTLWAKFGDTSSRINFTAKSLYELHGGNWQGRGDLLRGEALFANLERELSEQCGLSELPTGVKEQVTTWGPYFGEPNY